jgi:translation initiation factor 2B subunit (eIF-2B alpha/beta/delta family)
MHRIAADRKSGAIELALAVVEAFEGLSNSRPPPEEKEMMAAVKFLSNAQPSMVPIRNSAEMCARILAGGGESAFRLGLLWTLIESSRARVAMNSRAIFVKNAVVLTLSRSSTVLPALQVAARSGRLGKLFIMESRPRLEGRATAKAVAEMGVECTLVADAMGPSLVEDVDLAVVGADAILKDGGVVNKVGTYPLALACTDNGKPLCVLAESIKLDRRSSSETWAGSEERDEFELLPRPPRSLRALNRYFDLTPPANVSCVVHEDGISRQGWAKIMGKILDRLTDESA